MITASTLFYSVRKHCTTELLNHIPQYSSFLSQNFKLTHYRHVEGLFEANKYPYLLYHNFDHTRLVVFAR